MAEFVASELDLTHNPYRKIVMKRMSDKSIAAVNKFMQGINGGSYIIGIVLCADLGKCNTITLQPLDVSLKKDYTFRDRLKTDLDEKNFEVRCSGGFVVVRRGDCLAFILERGMYPPLPSQLYVFDPSDGQLSYSLNADRSSRPTMPAPDPSGFRWPNA